MQSYIKLEQSCSTIGDFNALLKFYLILLQKYLCTCIFYYNFHCKTKLEHENIEKAPQLSNHICAIFTTRNKESTIVTIKSLFLIISVYQKNIILQIFKTSIS